MKIINHLPFHEGSWCTTEFDFPFLVQENTPIHRLLLRLNSWITVSERDLPRIFGSIFLCHLHCLLSISQVLVPQYPIFQQDRGEELDSVTSLISIHGRLFQHLSMDGQQLPNEVDDKI